MTPAVLNATVLAFFFTSELFNATVSASNFNEKRRVKRYGERGHITIDTTHHDPFEEFNKESRKRQEEFQRKWDQLDRNSVFLFDLNKLGQNILISIILVKIFCLNKLDQNMQEMGKAKEGTG